MQPNVEIEDAFAALDALADRVATLEIQAGIHPLPSRSVSRQQPAPPALDRLRAEVIDAVMGSLIKETMRHKINKAFDAYEKGELR